MDNSFSFSTERSRRIFAQNSVRSVHWFNRKNPCVPQMGLVTMFCPWATTGTARFLVLTGEVRLVVYCRVNRVAFVGREPVRKFILASCAGHSSLNNYNFQMLNFQFT